MVPPMPARNVPNSMMPLPQESRCSGSNSGSKPYFEGPKSAPSVLIKNTPTNSIGKLRAARLAMKNAMTPSSNNFVPMVTLRLL